MVERESANFSLFYLFKNISYGLVRLGVPEFALKDEQKKAILAVYEGKAYQLVSGRAFTFIPSPLYLITSQWCRKTIYSRGALIQNI